MAASLVARPIDSRAHAWIIERQLYSLISRAKTPITAGCDTGQFLSRSG